MLYLEQNLALGNAAGVQTAMTVIIIGLTALPRSSQLPPGEKLTQGLAPVAPPLRRRSLALLESAGKGWQRASPIPLMEDSPPISLLLSGGP